MQQPDFKMIAAQLRQPTGSDGIETAERMNLNNGNMIRSCIDHLSTKEGDNILEIGPGGGLHVPYLFEQQKNISYTGADISETMVSLATENNSGLLEEGTAKFVQVFIENGWAALPFSHQSFDSIFTVNTLYFWDDALAQAKELHRVLKPGGLLALCFAPESFMQLLPFTQYGFNLYTPEKASQLLEQAGFKIKDIHTEKETVRTSATETMEREFMVMMTTA